MTHLLFKDILEGVYIERLVFLFLTGPKTFHSPFNFSIFGGLFWIWPLGQRGLKNMKSIVQGFNISILSENHASVLCVPHVGFQTSLISAKIRTEVSMFVM